jgi:hypothetical protein
MCPLCAAPLVIAVYQLTLTWALPPCARCVRHVRCAVAPGIVAVAAAGQFRAACRPMSTLQRALRRWGAAGSVPPRLQVQVQARAGPGLGPGLALGLRSVSQETNAACRQRAARLRRAAGCCAAHRTPPLPPIIPRPCPAVHAVHTAPLRQRAAPVPSTAPASASSASHSSYERIQAASRLQAAGRWVERSTVITASHMSTHLGGEEVVRMGFGGCGWRQKCTVVARRAQS